MEAAWRCAAAPGGYAWWYADCTDGRYLLTVILFAGAVFSPVYARRSRRGEADSGLMHPAVNVSVYEMTRAGAPAIAGVQQARRATSSAWSSTWTSCATACCGRPSSAGPGGR